MFGVYKIGFTESRFLLKFFRILSRFKAFI